MNSIYKIIKYIFTILYNKYKNIINRFIWRMRNLNNYTTIKNQIPKCKINVGKFSYGQLNLHSYNPKTEMINIGHFVSIADNVQFILGGNHNVEHFSTYPFDVNILKYRKYEAITKGPIIIEDDVWIGYGSIILSGVKIRRGTIIAAGSVVTKDTEEYSIYGGNPAKKIKNRFVDERIPNILKQIKFEYIDYNFIAKYRNVLYEKLSYDILLKMIPELKKIGAIDNEI